MSRREGIEKGMLLSVKSSLNRANKIDPNARALVDKLDSLPLTLSTAGAYLEHVTMSFAEYLRLYKESWLKL